MGFSLRMFFEELNAIFRADISETAKLFAIMLLTESAQKSAKECGIL